jgi:putative flippase GtrA
MSDYLARERIQKVPLDRLARFAVVGIAGTTVDMLFLALFHGALGIDLVVGKLASAELSFLFMFVINEHWTFSEFGQTTPRARLERLLKSNAVRLTGLATATVILVVLTWTTNMWYLLANAIGIGIGFIANYSLESRYTWRVQQ